MHGKHGIKGHIIGMLGIGGGIFVVLLLTGRTANEALYLAAVLSCPVMMIGMMLTMRGGDHQHDHQSTANREPSVSLTDAEGDNQTASHQHH